MKDSQRLLLVLEAILLTCLCILIIGVSVRLAALPAKRSSNPLPFNEQESTSRRYIGSTTCALPDRMLNSVAATSLTASSNAGSSRLGSSSAPIVGPTGPFDANVTCTPLQNVPAYDRILTWYGVQTDGPNTSGVVTIDMYTRNATQILNYMYQSPLNYTGICLQLDNPTGETVGQGKPPNYAAYIDEMVNLIAGIPIKYRVGFHAVVEDDATWQIVYGTPPVYAQTGCGKDGSQCTFTNYCTNSDPTFADNLCPPPSSAASCQKCSWWDWKPEISNCALSTNGTTTCSNPVTSGPKSGYGVPGSGPVGVRNNCSSPAGSKYPQLDPSASNTCPLGAPDNDPGLCQKCFFTYPSGQTHASNCSNTAAGCPGMPLASASTLVQVSSASPPCSSTPQPPYGVPWDPKNYGFNNYCWYESANSVAVSGNPAGGMPTVFPDLNSLPGERFAVQTSVTNVYGGGPVPCVAGSTVPCPSITSGGPPDFQANGQPYQTLALLPSNGESVCVYKAAGPAAAGAGYPDGCPGNMSRLAWYICYVNAKLRQKGSQQQVSMMNWDAEGNGNTGLQCATFQFLYGVRQFGTLEDVRPRVFDPVKSAPGSAVTTPVPWILYQNGAAGLASDTATSNPGGTQCGYWAQALVNTGARTVVEPNTVTASNLPGVHTYSDMAVFQAAPEYYWFNGEDMGGVANGGKEVIENHGIMKSLSEAGFLGCPQSAAGKPGVDAKCGCRRTVYESYAHKSEGGNLILDVLEALYDKINNPSNPLDKTTGEIAKTTPTFSIEHLGDVNNPLDFGECINAQNFDSQLQGPGCTLNSKCGVRCGVANFFGNWTENCFKQFLDGFTIRYGAKSVMIYDGGFLPKAWLPPNPPAPAQPFITTPNISVPKTVLSLPMTVNPTCVQTDVVVCDCDAASIASPATGTPSTAFPTHTPSHAAPATGTPSAAFPTHAPSHAAPATGTPSAAFPTHAPSHALPNLVPSRAIPGASFLSPAYAPSVEPLAGDEKKKLSDSAIGAIAAASAAVVVASLVTFFILKNRKNRPKYL